MTFDTQMTLALLQQLLTILGFTVFSQNLRGTPNCLTEILY